MRMMRAASTAAVILSIAASLVPGTASAVWYARGANLNIDRAHAADDPAITVTSAETITAWSEEGQIYVKLRPHGGAAWIQLGTTGLNRDATAIAGSPAITAIGSVPYVVWSEETGARSDSIYVSYWDGASWIPLGDSLNIDPKKWASYSSIATDGATVYATWDEYDSLRGWYNVYVKYWDTASASWLPLGGNLVMDPISGDGTLPDIELSSAGTPYVTWNEIDWGAGTSNVYVKYWNGATWVSVGGSLNIMPAGIAFFPAISIARALNRVYVAWEEDSQIYVKYWDVGGLDLRGGKCRHGLDPFDRFLECQRDSVCRLHRRVCSTGTGVREVLGRRVLEAVGGPEPEL